jgi:glutamyl/glutaminyl-tRNA synthetase
MNQVYIRNYPIDKLTDLVIPYLEKAGYDVSKYDREWLEKAVEVTREYFTVLADAPIYMEMFLKDEFEVEEGAKEFVLEDETRLKVIENFYNRMKILEGELTPGIFKQIVKEVGKELKAKGKNLFMPVRIGLTGRMKGVELDILVSLLGKERVLRRIENSLKQLNEKSN